jgi:succinate dehydrogenase/fumarate reductase-like Fe-S protein
MRHNGEDEAKSKGGYQCLSTKKFSDVCPKELTLDEALELIPFGKFHKMFVEV